MASKAIGFLNFKFGADLSGFERAMNKAQKKLKKFGTQLQKTGKNMTMGLTLPIVGVGIASAKMSMSFDKSMTKVITLVGIAEDEVNQMRKSVLLLSDKTGIAAVEMAEGLFFLTSAGLRGANALETLEQVAKATASGLGDMESLSKVAAAAQNAYGVETLTASEALDTFGGMVKTGMFEANELSQVLGGQMGLASSLGISMEELGAFIATYTKTTGDATSATTGLEGVMMSFAKITPKQEKALGKINMTVEQLRDSLSEQGLQKTLIMMASKFKNAGVDLSEFFSKSSSLKGVLGVLGNQTETYIDILGDLEGATFNVNDAFDTTSNMAGFQMTKSFNQLKNAGIEMGDALAPVILLISEKIQKLAEWFRGLSDSQKSNVVKWGLILAAIGPVLIIIGKMSVGIGSLIGAFKGLGKFIMANPYLALAAAVAVTVIAFTDLLGNLWGVNKAQQAVNDVNETALMAISDQKTEVALLTAILKDENSTLEEKETALQNLNSIAPEYYGKLNAAKLDVQALDIATQNYTASILQQAKAEAAKGKLMELNKQLLDLELGPLNKKNEFYILFKKELDDQVAAVMEMVVANEKLKKTPIVDKTDIENVVEETEEVKALNAEIERLNKLNEKLKKTPIVDTKDIEKEATAMEKLQSVLNGYKSDLQDLILLEDESAEGKKKIGDAAKLVTDAQDKLNIAQEEFKRLTTETKAEDPVGMWEELENAVSAAETALQNTLASGEDSTKALEDLEAAQDKLNSKTEEYLNLTKEGKTTLETWTDQMEKFEDITSTVLGNVLGVVDAFNKKMRIKAENENKIKTEAIDLNYETQKLAIENSLMDEEGKAKALEDLETTTQDAKIALEEETEGELAKIKKRAAIRDKAMAMADVIMTTAGAVMKAVAASPITIGMPWSGLIAAAGAVQLSVIASTPLPLAEGGLVTGPVTALIGEGVGTTASNPEVVSPLDKLRQFMSGDKIEVVGKLIGNDIYLSNRKTEFNRTRTV
tara:strand:+ start:523 stop:3507 length:2985 start_codon:yes stop_codon:yes gene_type:complete